MKKIIFAVIISFVFVNFVCAQESGVFLKLPISVKASGMGDAFAAVANDPLGMHYNPAGIAFFKYPSISLVHHIHVQDISGDSVGFVYPFKNLVLRMAPTIFKMKEEPIYDSFGNDTGESFGYQGTIIPVAAGYRFGDLALGASFKLYSEKIMDQSSNTNAFDIGAIYRFKRFQFGFSAQNFGGKIFDYDVTKIQRLGISYSGYNFGAAADIKKEGSDGTSLNFGGEITLEEILKFRGGWRLKENFGGLTAGFGLKLGNLNFDYALLTYGDLGNTHKAGISYRFGAMEKKKIKEKAKVAQPIEKPKIIKPMIARSTETINIAVVEVVGKNVSEADASIITDFLRTELVNSGLFNVMDRTNMETILVEQKFQNSGCTARECAIEMGQLLNVKEIIVGSLSKLLDTYYITANIVDVKTGEIIASYDSDANSSLELKKACKTIVENLSQR